MLRGRTLMLQRLGFSIDAPDARWTWTQASNPDQFHCPSPDRSKRFSVFVTIPEKLRPLDQAEADGEVAGLAESQEARTES
jgi:hypothetical protein